MRQFFLDLSADEVPAPGSVATLDAEESHHLRTVLRGGRDRILNLTDGRGRRYTARAAAGGRGRAAVEILTCSEDPAELVRPHLVLAVAVVKGKRFEWALEKAVELGAHLIVPLECERGVVEPGTGRRQRWQGILRSGLKQSGRSFLPDIAEAMPPAGVLASAAGPLWYGAAAGDREGRIAALQPFSCCPAELLTPTPPQLTICIGPEGGWSAAELDGFEAAGARALDLGPHVLRTETAAVAAMVVLQQWRGRAAPPAAGP